PVFIISSFACACHSVYRLLDSCWISQITMANRLEVVIKFLDERYTSGNVQINNLPVGDILQILHEGAQAVAMGRNEYLLPGPDSRDDHFLPAGHKARHGVLQTFRQRKLFFCEVLVAWILPR